MRFAVVGTFCETAAAQGTDVGLESLIRAAFFSSTLAVNNATVKFEIWDTAGQERRQHAEENGLFHGDLSAKTAVNVNDIFYEIAKRFAPATQPTQNPAGMVLVDRPAEGSRAASCCT
ncbi:hypothetical protein HAX54_007752 [Datura stramonium]|uniref:Uncharacterized protein n=1 Tax=Datura stramonium TaxID=4076 RepID=A0ABS8RI12_DATST|nr:hypothetical protein [Datura stramonium]